MNWRETLRQSFDQVIASGGFYALDVDYYVERRDRMRERCYRLTWSNRLSGPTGAAGSLVNCESGTLRTGPVASIIPAVTETLDLLSSLRRAAHSKAIAA
jgi:hypothetical protein